MSVPPERSFDRRRTISGTHEDRLCGLRDLLVCARGMTVLDIGMNHGLIGFELARFGAALVHGCDVHAPSVDAAREIFAELATPSRFEIIDLTGGAVALESAFGNDYRQRYDIVLFLGIYHKLKEQTSMSIIADLVRHLMTRTARYFVIRTPMIDELDAIVTSKDFRKVHYSALSTVVGPLAIWQRD
jgi:2-polyprenyl-3-methyl-5-hydroxy-6-metoxy-1,4-benzoquinol methylase